MENLIDFMFIFKNFVNKKLYNSERSKDGGSLPAKYVN